MKWDIYVITDYPLVMTNGDQELLWYRWPMMAHLVQWITVPIKDDVFQSQIVKLLGFRWDHPVRDTSSGLNN